MQIQQSRCQQKAKNSQTHAVYASLCFATRNGGARWPKNFWDFGHTIVSFPEGISDVSSALKKMIFGPDNYCDSSCLHSVCAGLCSQASNALLRASFAIGFIKEGLVLTKLII